MNLTSWSRGGFAAVLMSGWLAVAATGAEPPTTEKFDDALRHEAAMYRERQQQAAEALANTRARLTREKAPLLQQVRQAEDRLIRAETEARQVAIAQENAGEQRRLLVKEIDDVAKTTAYAQTLARDGAKAFADGFAAGEAEISGAAVEQLLQKLEKAGPGARGQAAADGAEFLVSQVEQALGGRLLPGKALVQGTNELYGGTLAFVGPEAFFRTDDGAHFGTLRLREGAAYPTLHRIAEWPAAEAATFFQGSAGTIPLDASGGKALRLAETKGTVWQHIRKGGVVAFAILGAGLIALALIIQKVIEVARMGVAPSSSVESVFAAIRDDDPVAAAQAARMLRGCTAQLFAAGLAHRDEPKPVLEELLESVLLEQRLHYERRLPLLAVIATASPLMGLLGTVIGMVRTFALITVFGTGNAGKLSSGISEVLVATELGLLVAIPTLVAHGFLAHRVQKNLATLEQYALQLATEIERGKSRAVGDRPGSALVA